MVDCVDSVRNAWVSLLKNLMLESHALTPYDFAPWSKSVIKLCAQVIVFLTDMMATA